MKDKQLRLNVKCTYWRMMAHLLTDDLDTKVRPAMQYIADVETALATAIRHT